MVLGRDKVNRLIFFLNLVVIDAVAVLCVVHERHAILLVVPIVVMALLHPVRCLVCFIYIAILRYKR